MAYEIWVEFKNMKGVLIHKATYMEDVARYVRELLCMSEIKEVDIVKVENE